MTSEPFAVRRRGVVRVVCFAHVTNQMGQTDLDFVKGEAGGAAEAPQVIEATIAALEHGGPLGPPDLPVAIERGDGYDHAIRGRTRCRSSWTAMTCPG